MRHLERRVDATNTLIEQEQADQAEREAQGRAEKEAREAPVEELKRGAAPVLRHGNVPTVGPRTAVGKPLGNAAPTRAHLGGGRICGSRCRLHGRSFVVDGFETASFLFGSNDVTDRGRLAVSRIEVTTAVG